MPRYLRWLPLLFVCSRLIAAEPIELTISTSAAPLQAWRALTVDWQILQWSGAQSVFFEVRAEGPWRITYPSGKIDEGIFSTVEPGSRLDYSFVYDEQTTQVGIHFRKTDSGCEMDIVHSEIGAGRAGDARRAGLLALWEEQLPLLTAYLDNTPGAYFVKPDRSGASPAVLLLHDRFGLNRTVRYYADSLAANGYVVLAVDMFKGDVTADLGQANRFLQVVNSEESVQAAREGLDLLRSDSTVNRRRIAVWGFGYGGFVAASLAAQVPEIKYCVSWYGPELPADDQISRIAAPVLGIFASATPTFAPPVAAQFDQRLVQAGVAVETVIVLGSDGFADPAYGTTYSPTVIRDAWQQTISRLDRALKL